MSITALKKITVCGLIDEKEKVLDRLQELGCIHLVSLRPPPEEPEKAAPEHPESAYKALKFLTDCPHKRHQVREDERFQIDQCVEKILTVKQNIRDLSDRCDFLAARIKEVEPWGDFKLPPPEDLAGLKLWFYIVPLGKLGELPKQGSGTGNQETGDQEIVRSDLIPDSRFPTPVWQIVHRDSRFAHVVVVAENEPPADAMPVARTHTGALSLSELNGRLNQSQIELEDNQAERESLTRWIYLITKNLARAEDKAGLIHAAEQTRDADEVFAVQGWAPEHDLEPISALAQQHGLAALAEDPGPSETPPTLLENPDSLAAGEDLVRFYKTPGYWDWDPAIPVFFSFSLFFAMIVSDAGYAALLGVLLVAYWHRMGRSSTGRRMRVLAAALVSSSLVWGILVGSYFGVSPAEASLLGKLKVLDVNDFDTMMRLSVGIGVLHLAFANFHKAWRQRQEGLTWLVPLGWIMIMVGGLFLWFAESLDQPGEWVSPTGKWHIGLGLAAVFLFSSVRPIKKATDVLMRILDGLQGLSNITKIFGDVLSYLRLFALGLASASLALTFNNLAMQARGEEGLGLLFSLLILIVGHGLNILLSLMSAVVHGMRLNCIEFFNWGLSDEGYPFKAFSKKEISE
jgi:V/A-type H+/Na+-transporting ATPase subunit I